MHSKRLLFFVPLLLCLAAPAASAQSAPTSPLTERAKALYEKGQEQYQRGDYEGALAQYKEAYLLVDAPALLFNIAQCYRLLGRREEAILSYRSFLEKVPDTPYRAEIEEHIQNLEAAPAPPEPATEPAVSPAPATAPAPPKEAPSLLRFALPAGLAAAGLAVGVPTFFAARAAKGNDPLVDDSQRRRTLLFTAAAADLSFAAAGVSLLLALRREPAAVALSPTAGGALLTLTLQGGAR